jgi:hypothetical protein
MMMMMMMMMKQKGFMQYILHYSTQMLKLANQMGNGPVMTLPLTETTDLTLGNVTRLGLHTMPPDPMIITGSAVLTYPSSVSADTLSIGISTVLYPKRRVSKQIRASIPLGSRIAISRFPGAREARRSPRP